jgi:hypothetical protein
MAVEHEVAEMRARLGRLTTLVTNLDRSGLWSADPKMRESLARLHDSLERARMHVEAEHMLGARAQKLARHEGSESGERARARRLLLAFRSRRSAAKNSAAQLPIGRHSA